MGIIIGSCVPEPEEPPRQTVFRGPVYGKSFSITIFSRSLKLWFFSHLVINSMRVTFVKMSNGCIHLNKFVSKLYLFCNI